MIEKLKRQIGILADAEQRRRLQDREREKEYEQIERAASVWKRTLTAAKPRDYAKWLAGYIEKGGAITHYHDYPSTRWTWYSATEDFTITPLYGSTALNIIVPAGVSVAHGDIGHNTLFIMSPTVVLGHVVPCFSDTVQNIRSIAQ